jgi:hypothetical protein
MEKFTVHSALADPNLKDSCWYKPSEIACAESLGLSMPIRIPGCPCGRTHGKGRVAFLPGEVWRMVSNVSNYISPGRPPITTRRSKPTM